MPSNYELIFLHSIPFLAKIRDDNTRVGEGGTKQQSKSRILYYYDAKHIGDGTDPIRVGLWNEDGSIRLDEDWKLRIQPRIDAWRSIIIPNERGVVQARAPKPSKPKRTSPKATTATTATTATVSDAPTNTVVYPANPKSRSRGVRKNTKRVS